MYVHLLFTLVLSAVVSERDRAAAASSQVALSIIYARVFPVLGPEDTVPVQIELDMVPVSSKEML